MLGRISAFYIAHAHSFSSAMCVPHPPHHHSHLPLEHGESASVPQPSLAPIKQLSSREFPVSARPPVAMAAVKSGSVSYLALVPLAVCMKPFAPGVKQQNGAVTHRTMDELAEGGDNGDQRQTPSP
ncbi:hypothetical protein RRG08_054869 [Elysia crispata]|uniref:Uncharacterized protein n=1 Tax=Elysia crispata TaxID=231223 RepID=A0AAE1DTA6_9GAST|nr:hypothetical protein RRG08_054869 [Elysia crispata]